MVQNAVMAIEGGHEPFGPAIDAPDGADVRAAVALGAERTTAQDPAFGFRQLVDIAHARSGDKGDTANVGIIQGGTARNVVPAEFTQDQFTLKLDGQLSANRSTLRVPSMLTRMPRSRATLRS